MTTVFERTTTAFLDNEDSLNIPNIIHSTEGAKAFGYDAPLVGGVTVYGWGVPAILDALGEQWLSDGWMDVSFKRPVFPGFELTTRLTERPDGSFDFSMSKPDGTACLAGTCGLRRAPWYDALTLPPAEASVPPADPMPQLTPGTIPVGEELRPQPVEISLAEAEEYARTHQKDDHPRWRGDGALIHPGWLSGRATRLMHHSFSYGPSIHARSQIQHLAPAVAGQTITVTGRFVEAFERKGHQYAVVDVAQRDEPGELFCHLRHTTIYQVAKRD